MTTNIGSATLIRDVAEHSGAYTTVGVILVVLGFLTIAAPFVAGVATVYALGGVLIVAGLTRCILAFGADSFGAGMLGFALGALALLAGALLFAQPVAALATITLLLSAYFIVHGVFESIFSIRLRAVEGWGWVLASGILSIVLGFMMAAKWPSSSMWAVGVLLGVQFISGGASMIGLGSMARRANRLAKRVRGSPGA